MGLCKDCKWWKDREESIRGIEFVLNSEWKKCIQPLSDPYRNDESLPSNGLFYEDDSGCYELLTGPDFGCVNFETKESKT